MRKKIFALSLVLSTLHPVWASGGGGKPGGLLDINPGLAFWTVVTFAILMAVLKVFAWKPLLEGLELREHQIRDAIEESETSLQEAQAVLKATKKRWNEANYEARHIVDDAYEKARLIHEEGIATTEQECNKLKADAQKQIEDMTKKAMEDVLGHVGDLGIEIAEKLMLKSLNAADHTRLIEQSMEEIHQRMAGKMPSILEKL